jgi:hypothetical protein
MIQAYVSARPLFSVVLRFPLEDFLDERVVGIAAGHALRRVEIVFAVHFDTRNLLDLGEQFVDGDQSRWNRG